MKSVLPGSGANRGDSAALGRKIPDSAKKIIENNNIKEINHYIDLYSKFVKETEQIELPPEEIEVEKDIMKEIAAEKVEGA